MTLPALLYYSSHLQVGFPFLPGGHEARRQKINGAIGRANAMPGVSKLKKLPFDFNAGLTSLQLVEEAAENQEDSRHHFAAIILFLNHCLDRNDEQISSFFINEFPVLKKNVEAMFKTIIEFAALSDGDPHRLLTAFPKEKRNCPRQAEVPSKKAPQSLPMTYEDFTVLSVIGKGTFAKVVQAEHKETQKLYAIKIIKKEQFLHESDPAWIQTEKNIFATCTNHPFLVGLHYSFQTDSRLFFVIDYVPCGDLQYLLRSMQKIPENLACFYAAEISVALYFLHTRGIIHRDLKLRNVLLDADGHVKVSDYGLSKENLEDDELSDTLCGTPCYMAPEMLEDGYSYSVDWWSLGVMLYEMMTGELIGDSIDEEFNELKQEVIFCQKIVEQKLREQYSLLFQAATVVRQLLCPDPKKRLGCGEDIHKGYRQLQKHSFFEIIDWKLLEEGKMTPPFKPNIKDSRDVYYFNPRYTKLNPRLTIDNPATIAQINQNDFRGFEVSELE